jgi:hypothetical protein
MLEVIGTVVLTVLREVLMEGLGDTPGGETAKVDEDSLTSLDDGGAYPGGVTRRNSQHVQVYNSLVFTYLPKDP